MNEKKKRTLAVIFFRTLIVLVAIFLWFWTQSLIGANHPTGLIQDTLLNAVLPLNHYLAAHLHLTKGLILITSAYMDCIALCLIVWGVFGRSFRPFLGLMIVLALRQLMQVLVHLPLPPDKIWFDPGFPSLFATYSISNDLYFSGHTAVSVYGAIQLFYLDFALGVFGTAMALFEIIVILALRYHWTMDIFTGLIVAILSSIVAHHVAPPLDKLIERALKRRS